MGVDHLHVGDLDWFPETAVAEGASDQPINGIALCQPLGRAQQPRPEQPKQTKPPEQPPEAQPKPEKPQKSYPNCPAMNEDYPHGAGLPKAKDQTADGDPVTNFKRDADLYRANTARDADDDKIACEKH